MTAPEYVFRTGCLFGGGGGMALGTQWATRQFRGCTARFELCGSYDNSSYACQVYEYLTGCAQTQLDARTATPGDVYRLFNSEPPDVVWISAPCKGSSKLLSTEKAKTKKYAVMNTLSYRGVKTLLEAFVHNEPAFIIFENVPNITTRAAPMLKELRKLAQAHGYLEHAGYHEARHIGDLAQRRKRWFNIWRNPRKAPVLVYQPPHKAGKVCGDVLGPLPLPNDPAGGPMHRLGDTSMINLLRLWAIPAGGDWRDLIADGRPRRERFRRHHIEKWDEPSVTIGGSGSNGPCGVADPREPSPSTADPRVLLGRERPGFTSMDHVLPWDGAARTVTGATRPGNGAPSIADPILHRPWPAAPPELAVHQGLPLNLLGGAAPTPEELERWHREGVRPDGKTALFGGKYGVTAWDEPTRTVIGGEANGASYVADPRPVPLPNPNPGPQPLDLLDGRTPTAEEQARWEREGVAPEGATSWYNGAFGVTPWDSPSRTVIAGKANGAAVVADPRIPVDMALPSQTFHHVDRVTSWGDATGTVTHAPAPSSGAPAVADPRVPEIDGSNFNKYGVLRADEPAGTVTAEAAPSTGRFAYAAPVPLQPQAGNRDMHWGKYVVVPWGGATLTVTGASRVGSGAGCVADPRVNLATADSAFHQGTGPGRWGVLAAAGPASTVTGNARVNTGPFAYAAPAPVNLVPEAGVDTNHAGRYGVLRKDEPSRTVTGTTRVGCGAYAIADDVPGVSLELGCASFAGAYGVNRFDAETATVTAYHKVDNRPAAVADPRPVPLPYVVLSYAETKRIVDGEIQVPFAIVDPAHPSEPLAIVDSLKRPPFRWVLKTTKTKTKRGKIRYKVTRIRETVALVLIAEDGTWHRPLTTLELAVLQSFPSHVRGKPLDFGGGTTAQREVIGNAVPAKVAQSMGEQILLSLMTAMGAVDALGPYGTKVWVQNVRALEQQLRAEGLVVVKPNTVLNFTTGAVLDDGATVWRKDKTKKSKKKRRAAVRPHQEYEAQVVRRAP